jgi:hypothetical protein
VFSWQQHANDGACAACFDDRAAGYIWGRTPLIKLPLINSLAGWFSGLLNQLMFIALQVTSGACNRWVPTNEAAPQSTSSLGGGMFA